MKKTLIASLMMLSMAGTASAAGQFDGIYKDPSDPNGYLSVHQNGVQLIVTAYSTKSISGTNFPTVFGDFVPSRIDHWDLLSGTISGVQATVEGEVSFGACKARLNLAFSSTQLAFRIVSFTNTSRGVSQGIFCGNLNGPVLSDQVVRFQKIF